MISKSLKYSALLAVSLGAAALAGCGSSNKGGSASLDSVALVDEASCRTCHANTLEPLTGDSIITQFNNSPHVANGCQSCHGGGSLHNGVGPMPYAKPGPEQCATCHEDNDSTEYATSGHATVDTEGGEAKCNRCHTHEGAVLGMKNGFTGDKTVMDAMVNAPQAIANASTIQCATCHVMHEGTLRTDSTWDPALKVGAAVGGGSDEYNLCTGCHTYINEAGQLVASGNNGTAQFYHNTAWNRTIASTHYDNPATNTTNGKLVEGYVLRTDKANPCFDCHGHEAKTNTNILSRNSSGQYVRITPEATIYTDWAKSAHAGGILQAKYDAVDAYPKKADGTYNRSAGMTDAVMAVGATDATGIGWTYYNWDDNSSRGSCQRCHTSTGAANFMSNPAGYVAANNTFPHLSGWAAAGGSPQQEVLYCWGCHSNAGTGELRTPGTPTFTYTNGATASYPDVAGSNVCMTCHTGRETGDSIKNDADADGVRSFINSHYLSAGGQLFGKTGYEFAGVSYDNPSYFEHDQIGSAAAPGTGSNGPCVGCHMTTANTHSFKVVTKDGTGTITAINSTACATCHTGAYALTPASLTAEEEDYVAALEALKAALASKGIHFFNAHPYFYQAAGGAGGAFTNWAGVYGFASWKDVMGAAFNANLLLHDPGGYAHNRIYSKRLIWDSIDFITDGTLGNVNMATTIDGFGLDAATTAAAKAYLGTTRP